MSMDGEHSIPDAPRAVLKAAFLAYQFATEDSAFSKSHKCVGTIPQVFLVKAVSTMRAIAILCAAGLTCDAMVLARTVIESAIDLHYICDDPGVRVPQYMDFTAREWRKAYSNLQKFAGRSRIVEVFGEDKVERRDKKTKALINEFKARNIGIWKDRAYGEKAKATGLSRVYDFGYEICTEIAHGSPIRLRDYTQVVDDGVVAAAHVQHKYVNLAVLIAGTAFLSMLCDVVQILKVSDRSGIDILQQTLKVLADK